MNNFKKNLLSILLILILGCSSEQAKDSNNTQDDVFDLKESQESFKFEPVVVSPEDKLTADNAPEGMVFIKGGCFMLGNT